MESGGATGDKKSLLRQYVGGGGDGGGGRNGGGGGGGDASWVHAVHISSSILLLRLTYPQPQVQESKSELVVYILKVVWRLTVHFDY